MRVVYGTDAFLVLHQQLVTLLVVVAQFELLVEQAVDAVGADVDPDSARDVLRGQRVLRLANDVDVVLEVQEVDFVGAFVRVGFDVLDVQDHVFVVEVQLSNLQVTVSH